MKKDPQEVLADNSARFQIRGSSAPDADILATFATREEADVALAAKQEERAQALSAVSAFPALPVIVDTGVRALPSPNDANIEAGKTAEEKAEDLKRTEIHVAAPGSAEVSHKDLRHVDHKPAQHGDHKPSHRY